MSIKDKQGIQPEVREILAPVMDNLPLAAEAELAGGAALADVITTVNSLLGKLRAAHILEV